MLQAVQVLRNGDTLIKSGDIVFVFSKRYIAEALHLELDQVNIKATTEEGLGFTGTGEGISSQAVCLIDKPEFYMDGTIGCGGCGGCKN